MSTDNLPRRDITRDEARRRTDKFKAHTEAWLEELVSLFLDEVWWSLGYESWDDYCQAEFGSIKLPRGTRTGAVLTLREAGMSVRAIASALGIGVGTVHREIAAEGDPIQIGDYILNADGTFQLKRPATAEIEVPVPDGTPTPEIEGPTVPEPGSEGVEIDPGVPDGTPTPENGPSPAPEAGSEDDEGACRKCGGTGFVVVTATCHGQAADDGTVAELTPQQQLFETVNGAVARGTRELNQIAADHDLDPDLVAVVWAKSWKAIGEGRCPTCGRQCHDPASDLDRFIRLDPCRPT